jgi:hypothetical protein
LGESNERSRWEGDGPSKTEIATSPADRLDSPRDSGNAAQYQARWISKEKINHLRRSGGFGRAVLVDYRTGFVIVEPVGSNLGDGEVLTPELANYELREAWCPTPKSKLVEARKLLGLNGSP